MLGPMAIFPRTVLSWNVGNVLAINEDSLILFCLLEPKIGKKIFCRDMLVFLICLDMKLSVTLVSCRNILQIRVFCNLLPYIGNNITEALAICIVRVVEALTKCSYLYTTLRDVISWKTVIFSTAVRASDFVSPFVYFI